MKLNKHGIKMVNVREISGATVNDPKGYSQISYDLETGELFEVWHPGNSDQEWSEYHDENVIHICNTRRHMTMQEIADAVYRELAILERA